MKYSPELIQKVKECYPDKPELHKLAEQGSIKLMDEVDPSWGVIAIETVLEAKSFKEIKTYAKLVGLKRDVADLVATEISNHNLKRKP